ncbi:MAG: multicopper oxidase domain-containing protein [Bacteroidia bacterium]
MKILKFILFIFLSLAVKSRAQNVMPIPDTLSGPVINLTMHRDSVQFFPGRITHTYAFNTHHYQGPVLILKKGFNVRITVNNQIGDTTTMHWHGLHVASRNDGGPYSMIMNGMSWNPQFTVLDKASTYWYHPHMDKKTAEQAIKGAAGMIIVRDSAEAVLNLPRTYGVDDFPIAVQSLQFDSVNQPMPKGMVDSTLLVNGVMSAYTSMPAQLVRIRLLNASGERTFNFGFSGNKYFYQIGSDGGLLQAPYYTNRIRLSPGERGEVLLDLSGMNGQTIYLMSYGSEIPMGVAGGPTMPMPAPSPPMNSPLNGIDFNILKINVDAPTASPVTGIPASLVPVTPYPVSSAGKARTIVMTSVDSTNMDGPFLFNGQAFNMSRIDYYIPVGSVEVWTLINNTMVGHPFHIHDSQFYVVDRKRTPPGPSEAGRKDVVLLFPYDTIRIITKFEDFTNDTIPYMFHCHILMHEDDGMMGQFLVVPASEAGIWNLSDNTGVRVYPNPVNSILNIVSEKEENSINRIGIYDVTGRRQLESENKYGGSVVTLSLESLSPGIYFIQVSTRGGMTVRKFIKG